VKFVPDFVISSFRFQVLAVPKSDAGRSVFQSLRKSACQLLILKHRLVHHDFLGGLGALLLLLTAPVHAQTNANITPAAWLASRPKPDFAANSHLPHLAKWSWPLPYDLRVEMATNWGYALEVDGPLVNGGLQKALANSNSASARLVALCAKYPDKFKLQVNLDRDWPTNLSRGFWVTNAAGYFVDDQTNLWLDQTNRHFNKVVSPEAPDADLANESEFQTAPLKTLLSNAPIAIILNGGERDLGVPGFDLKAWRFDPRVMAAMTNVWSYPSNLSGVTWPRYVSDRKAHQLGFLTSRVRQAVPHREMYVYYNTGNEQYRLTTLPHQKETNDWHWRWEDQHYWGYNSDVMLANTDLPSFECYFTGAGSWTNSGLQYHYDLLTMYLNGVGYNHKLGAALNYSWVCGGWSNTDTNRLADLARYTGFLKCLYTGGMVGAVAGYFEYPTGTNATVFGEHGYAGTFPADTPPHWLRQIEVLGRVHALFSHLDDYLYHGDLLPGDHPHAMSQDQPAYEFTNTVADATARVLVRKMNGTNLWLACAWAASGGDRNVTVTIPTAGRVTLKASVSGAVYKITTNSVTLVDTNNL
jgi:hypothetical protein